MSELDITPYRVCFSAVKQPGRDVEYVRVHPYSAEVQNEWSYTSAAAAALCYLHIVGRAPLPLPD